MGDQPETRILCLTAATWVLLYGFYVIVTSVLAAVGLIVLMVLLPEYNLKEEQVDGQTDVTEQDEATAKRVILVILMFALILILARLILGVWLIIANRKGRTCIMWTWVVILGILVPVTLVGSITRLIRDGDIGEFIIELIEVLVMSFALYAIWNRIQDIKTSHGYNNGVVLYTPA